MALSNLDPVTREEAILNSEEITPISRSEYFLQKAINKVPTPDGAEDAGKVPTVNSAGTGFTLETPAAGGSGVFIVTITTTYDETLQQTVISTVDKTIEEIIEAFEDGQIPYLFEASTDVGGIYTPNLIDSDNSSLGFYRIVYGSIISVAAYVDEVSGDDTWEYSEGT